MNSHAVERDAALASTTPHGLGHVTQQPTPPRRSTWQQAIAATVRYTEPHYKTRPNIMDLRHVDDFVIDHHEVDCGDTFPVFSTPEERLIMRAFGIDLDEATKIVRARNEIGSW